MIRKSGHAEDGFSPGAENFRELKEALEVIALPAQLHQLFLVLFRHTMESIRKAGTTTKGMSLLLFFVVTESQRLGLFFLYRRGMSRFCQEFFDNLVLSRDINSGR